MTGVQTCALDRKSTRLNSSHTIISYAVFCLKKKTASHCSTRLTFSYVSLRSPLHAVLSRTTPRRVPRGASRPQTYVLLFRVMFFFLNNPPPPKSSPFPHPAALRT